MHNALHDAAIACTAAAALLWLLAWTIRPTPGGVGTNAMAGCGLIAMGIPFAIAAVVLWLL